jgi:hypothetical protein
LLLISSVICRIAVRVFSYIYLATTKQFVMKYDELFGGFGETDAAE